MINYPMRTLGFPEGWGPETLARLGLEDSLWLDPATAAAIVIISLIVAFVFYKFIFPLILRATQWTPRTWTCGFCVRSAGR